MTRFLRRGTPNETAAPADTASDSTAPPPATPRRTPARRRTSTNAQVTAASAPPAPTEVEPSRRRSRRTGPSNGSTPNAEPKPTRRRGSRRSAEAASDRSSKSDPAASGEDQLLAALERQNALLQQQGQALTQLQEATAALAASQQQLTQTLLGTTGDFSAPSARIEVLPRLAIFVDVPNILYGAESSGVRLNWGKVAEFLSHGRTLVRAIAYAPISDDPNARIETERFVTPFLDHDYRVATKPLKRFTGGSVKANFDVELAIDVLTMSDRVDVIVLVSGDGDFRRLVEIVGARGVRVEVMAFGRSTSRDLIEVADRYIDIAGYVSELVD